MVNYSKTLKTIEEHFGEDIAQDIRELLLAEKLKETDPLYIIAKNKKRDVQRRESLKTKHRLSLSPKPSYCRDNKEQVRMDVDEAIGRLKHAEILRRHLEGWTMQEISNAFGYSTSTIDRIIRRAKASLREDLADYGNVRPTSTCT